MNKKESTESSRFVSRFAIALFFLGAALCFVWKKELPAGLLLFLALFTGAARIWGLRAMQDLTLEAEASPSFLYPGGSVEFRYEFGNDKLLPLPWVEIGQDLPERCCLQPADEDPSRILTEGPEETRMYRCTFSGIRSHETVTFALTWNAVRRGLYRPKHFFARSGDGFGLMQAELAYPEEQAPFCAVWPEKVGVDISPFLLQLAEDRAGKRGRSEDLSVIRGMRDYTPADSRKRINRRMEAKDPDRLQVNLYETLQPGGLLFVLDGESFALPDPEEENETLEEALKTLGSVLTELFSAGLCCGLCLPRSRAFGPVSLPPEGGQELADVMLYLAGYECRAERKLREDGSFTGELLPSRFAREAAGACMRHASSIYIVTADPARVPEVLLPPAFAQKTTILSDRASAIPGEQRLRRLSALRR